MDIIKSSKMLRVSGDFGNTQILDTIKKPVSVTISDSSAYANHLSATQVIGAIVDNKLDTTIIQKTNEYNTLTTRSYTHMLKGMKNPIRMDQLLNSGYKYLVVRIPFYYVRRAFNPEKRDYINPGWGSAAVAMIHMCGVNSSGKLEYTKTNEAIKNDPYFGKPPSVNSMNPFNIVSVDGPYAEDVGQYMVSGNTYDLQYSLIGIDMNYAVNKLGCKACCLATVGFSGDFYFNTSIDIPADNLSHYDSDMILPVHYYYM